MSFTATKSSSLSWSAVRRMLRPIRPNPLIPTRIAMASEVLPLESERRVYRTAGECVKKRKDRSRPKGRRPRGVGPRAAATDEFGGPSARAAIIRRFRPRPCLSTDAAAVPLALVFPLFRPARARLRARRALLSLAGPDGRALPPHLRRADGPPARFAPRGAGGRSGSTRSRWGRCWRPARWWRRSRRVSPIGPSCSPPPPSPATRSRSAASRGTARLFFAPFDWPGPVRRALDRAAARPAGARGDGDLAQPDPRGEASRRPRGRWSTAGSRQRSHRGYRRIRPFLRRVLGEIDLFLMQGEAHAERIRDLGAPAGTGAGVGQPQVRRLEAPKTSEPCSPSCAGTGAARGGGQHGGRGRGGGALRLPAGARARPHGLAAHRSPAPRALRPRATARARGGAPLRAPVGARAGSRGRGRRRRCSTPWGSWRRSMARPGSCSWAAASRRRAGTTSSSRRSRAGR